MSLGAPTSFKEQRFVQNLYENGNDCCILVLDLWDHMQISVIHLCEEKGPKDIQGL